MPQVEAYLMGLTAEKGFKEIEPHKARLHELLEQLLPAAIEFTRKKTKEYLVTVDNNLAKSTLNMLHQFWTQFLPIDGAYEVPEELTLTLNPNPNPNPNPHPDPNPNPNPNPNPEQVEEACDSLSVEEEAKRAWIARLDAPTWGAVAAAVSEVAAATGPAGGADNEEAKQLWLSKVRLSVSLSRR